MPSARVELARLDADLAKARRRRELLSLELDMSSHVRGCAEPADLDVKIADVAAAILELEERGAELSGAAPPNAAPAPAAAPPAPAALPEYLDTKQAAAMLGVSVKTLEACRARGKPPPFTKIGRRVRYPLEGIRDLTRKK